MASFLPSTIYGGASLWGPGASSTAAQSQADLEREFARRYGSINEARTRYQMESDREYDLRVKGVKQQAAQIAITKGQQEANEWYNRQMVKLAMDKFGEEVRQFDMTFGEGQRQFDQTFGEGQRQFDTSQSGYLNGAPTLAREQFQDQSLGQWTDRAIDLGSRPEDWVKLRRMQSGVSNNLQSMPGLNWTTGGQQGNQAFYGQPQSSSLGSVFGGMGIGGGWATQATGQAAAGNVAMTPDEASLYQTAREFGMNPHQSAPGWYEAQDPLTQDLLKGAGQAQGLDWASVMSRYNRSRWGGAG